MSKWRVIFDGDRSAAFNMAADEAIFRCCADGNVPPTLRLYGWSGASVSLGRLQHDLEGKLDAEYCREMGISLVRRPTGGRAVLHGHDVTFSISLRESLLPREARGVVASHKWLMSGIAAGLKSIGARAEIGPEANRPTPASLSADCFAHVAECDIRVGKDKVVGAAQARSRGALLEQGSIPRVKPLVDPARVFPSIRSQDTALVSASREEIEQAIAREFSRVLGIELEPAAFTDEEKCLAMELEKTCVVEL
ncbi:MAG TPA: biotin/lipoate A/B protein ligase family protein [Armatimonadota bacterium]